MAAVSCGINEAMNFILMATKFHFHMTRLVPHLVHSQVHNKVVVTCKGLKVVKVPWIQKRKMRLKLSDFNSAPELDQRVFVHSPLKNTHTLELSSLQWYNWYNIHSMPHPSGD